jgi:hypothetical protein
LPVILRIWFADNGKAGLAVTTEFLILVAIGFLAQIVDGALGMAFGVITTTTMLSMGVPPALASATVHTAEIATTGASGLSHLYHRNIDKRLLITLGTAGVAGGVFGAYVLSNIDGSMIRPFIAIYLFVMGAVILLKALRWSHTRKPALGRRATGVLGAVGGFLDAVGGGGWGPIVTSTLLGSGHAPRTAIGSVNAAEFFVTTAISVGFLAQLGAAHWDHVLSLVIGGLAAAPFAGYILRYIRPRLLMALVGLLVCGLSLLVFVQSLG